MTRRGALELRDLIARGDTSAKAVCDETLDRVRRSPAQLNAFVAIGEERARAAASALRSHPDPASLPLLGVPIAVKDNICTRGVRTTAGSRVLENYIPPYDAAVIERLESAGAVIVAKTNCDEFAMGSSTEHSAFGPSRNPWDPERTAGGSSGGSAIAVATGVVPLALGSETGGSVRQPAALCGVVGVKPTYGRISRYGLIAFASSLDQVGVFGANVKDAAACLGVLAGPDPRDATSAPVAVEDYVAATTQEVGGLRIGVPHTLMADGVDPGVREAFDASLDALRAQGAILEDIDLPHSRYGTATYAVVVMAEASSNLGRFDGVRYGSRVEGESLADMYARTRARFGDEVKRRIMIGTYVLSAGYYDAYYRKAQQVRMLIRQDFERAFERVDVIATPTTPTTAFKLGERLQDPVQMYLADVFTVSANLAGIPAISVPCGLVEGLPAGLQLTGRPFGEAALFRAAAAYERIRPLKVFEPPTS
ncbi:MAG: Asp-tRNA(Asn)/Glu-tRNA(Gln) amidotransferase subunit GatA [Acidobacteriota bacterium]|nr:Asp-tRNA(Asn)/Glu-tRNA(Gln) amidotransferase subunit GatA [Acidobacteriota bacterium]MDQ3417370.1 Asp-tRNA(Asn)/Glu-tRNA(Gln) amidotransferase subunit GatA [Acidobacteriota bacterium]